MKLLMDDLETDINSVTFRDFGFGKEVPKKEKIRYLFQISIEEFIAASEKLINDFVSECKADDEISIVGTMGLRELGYPTFEQMLSNDKSLLIGLIKEYLPIEFLSGFLKVRKRQNGNMQSILLIVFILITVK